MCFYDSNLNLIAHQYFSRHASLGSYVYVFGLDIKFDECYHPNINYLKAQTEPLLTRQVNASDNGDHFNSYNYESCFTIMSIILGLDIGDARTGVAISDELGIAAHPLCTIQRRSRKAVLAEIQKLVAAHNVEQIVVGLPLQLDGETGIQAKKVKQFAEKLEQQVNLPIAFWDESFTTFEAAQILRGTKKRRKKRKQVIDQVAAVLILEGYLEELRSSRGKGQVHNCE